MKSPAERFVTVNKRLKELERKSKRLEKMFKTLLKLLSVTNIH